MPPTGGLIGLISSSSEALRKRLLSINHDGALMRIFVMCVVGAAVLSTLEATLAKAPVGSISFWKFGLLGLGCVLAELMGLKRAITSFHEAKIGQTMAWSVIWACGFLAAIYGAASSAALNSAGRANVQKAAHTSYSDARDAVAAARARVKTEEKALADYRGMGWQPFPNVDGKPVMSADAASALIKGMESNTRFYRDLTKGCTDTAGKDTRKFCKDLGDARAAEKDLLERAKMGEQGKTMEAQLASARSDLAAAITAAAHTDTVVSDVTPMVHFVSQTTGRPPEQLGWIEAAQSAVINMLLVSFAGLAMGLAEISGKPRTPIFGGMFGALLRGRQSPTQALASAASRPGGLTITDQSTRNALIDALGPLQSKAA